MNTTRTCPQCGAALPEDAPDAPCQACLMKIGLQQWSQSQTGDDDYAQTAVQSPDFDAPTIEQMAQWFPQFEFQRMLGLGGMGAVYLARQRSLDRDVAIKIIKPSAAEDGGFAERFAREARALARLSHHNIVTVHDFGDVENMFYFVMEYVDGVNLRQAMREQKITPEQALSIIPQVCDALQYAHDEGIVHRDIKPENILLDKRGRVKIADFGLAKLLRRAPVDVTLTSANQVMGTMHYMAPEQLERPLDVDHRADIYSLGVVLYEMMTGELPIGRFELPSERRLDARLDEVVLRTLERKPERRYDKISELKTDVESISHDFHPEAAVAPAMAAGMGAAVAAAGDRRGNGSATVSVPFTITRDGTEGARGLVRFNGRQLEFDFTVTDDAEWSEAFTGFTAGAGMAVVPLTEVATATYEPLWFGARLGIQANSIDAVGKVPGNDRGRVDLSIEKRDRDSALTMVNSMRRVLGQPELKAEPSGDDEDLVAHKGTLLMGLGFVIVGLFMLSLSIVEGGSAYLWVGLGIVIGGGSMMGGAFSDKSRIPRSLKPDPSNLITGGVMFAIGFLLLFGVAFFGLSSFLVWVGMGLALGGSGTLSSAWPTASSYDSSDPAGASAGKRTSDSRGGVAEPKKPLDSTTPDLAQRGRLRPLASVLFFFAILNFLVVAGLGIFLAYALKANHWRIFTGDDLAFVAFVLNASIALPSLITGGILLRGARSMRSCRSYGWAMTAAIFAMLPFSGFFPFSFLFGFAACLLLMQPTIKREFEVERNRVEYASG